MSATDAAIVAFLVLFVFWIGFGPKASATDHDKLRDEVSALKSRIEKLEGKTRDKAPEEVYLWNPDEAKHRRKS